MFEKVLLQMQENVRHHAFVMTSHTRKEMDEDELTIYDVEQGIHSGEILERRKIKKPTNGNIGPMEKHNMTCDICGQEGAKLRNVTETYGKGIDLLVVEDIPMFSCLHCGESYFTAETLHEIERIKNHRHELAVKSTVEVAQSV